MSWFDRWKREPLAAPRNIADLSGEELADEKARTEIEKTRVEILDERAWRTKLLLSLLIPVGGALAFLNTWHSDRVSERVHRNDQLFTDAAQQLSSNDASVRLNAILTLDSFVTERSWFDRILDTGGSASDCGSSESVRGRQSVALIIGHLVSEPDSSVLDAIARTADDHPCLTVETILSVDRSAAVQFARTAGTFAGLYILRRQKAAFLGDDMDLYSTLSDQAIQDIDNITLRTGSPFEAKNLENESFASRTFLSKKCPFRGLYDKQLRLTMSIDLTSPLLANPPGATMVQASLQKMEESAAVLEKSSYVLSKVASTKRGIDQLQQVAKREDLYGVAIVVGEMDAPTITRLRAMGAYVQQYGVDGVCTVPPGSSAK